MNRQRGMNVFVLLLMMTVGILSQEAYSENSISSIKKMIKDRLFSISSGNITLVEVEEKLGLTPPIKMKRPTDTDPLWWFVYEHQGLLVKLGTNSEKPVFTLENATRTNFYYTGYFLNS